MDGVEKGLAKFLAAYKPFLGEMAQFATPIFSGLLAKAQKVPEDQRETNQGLMAAVDKAFTDLEAKAQYFSDKFNALPIPTGAAVEKTRPYQFPLTDLFVFRLNYGSFELNFQHTNKKIALGEQMHAALLGSAIPGSTVNEDVRLWLPKPIVPTWESLKQPRLLKPEYDGLTMYNGSEHGHVEMELHTLRGAFWSLGAWSAKKTPEVQVEPSNAIGADYHSIGNANFKLKAVGTGELDAFLQYVSKIAATPMATQK